LWLCLLNVAREAAIWELEEQHLKDKAQLARRQLKDLYFIKRYQMINRHEKVGTTSVRVCVFDCVRGKRLPGGRHKRYKDGLEQNLKTCVLPPNELNSAPLARASWPSRCRDAIDDFEATHVGAIQTKWQARKTTTVRTTGQWACNRCGRVCQSWIGLYAHRKYHR